MAKSVTAFCPGHISGYFCPVFRDSIIETGSRGAGIVINEGVTAIVTKSDTNQVIIERYSKEGKCIETVTGSEPIDYLLRKLGVTASIVTKTLLPLYSGFGLSAASLLASAYAANEFFSLGLCEPDISRIAHEVEVIHKTGLGDVSAARGGGREWRQTGGINAEVIRSFDLHKPLVALTLGPLYTKEILSAKEGIEKIIQAFPNNKPETPEEFFRLSRRFAEKSYLIPNDCRPVLDECDRVGVSASMTMLGNGIFAYGYDAFNVLLKYGNPFLLQMAENGPVILEVQL